MNSLPTPARMTCKTLCFLGMLVSGTLCHAQNNNNNNGGGFFGRQNNVGGVIVDAGGVVRSATLAERQQHLAALRQVVKAGSGELAQATPLRMISLKGLQQAIAQALADDQALSDEVRLLAGLQRIEYVFAMPESQDIVIAGPAEPWTVRNNGAVVGANSGKPMMVIDDLVTAMQSVEAARQAGISCSIEPTPEGYQRLTRMLSNVRLQPGQHPGQLELQMRQAFGPQLVKLTGVPRDSHYARVLVAADYQMKRISMGLEPSGIAALPSYMAMARNQLDPSNANPRWWMACDYNALTHSEDGLVWQLNRRGVKTMVETDLRNASGEVVSNAKANPTAQRWADLMTENYDALTDQFPVFGELRNVIDLSIVATLIVQTRMEATTGANLDLLYGRGDEVPIAVFTAPETISPECSFVRGRKGWVASASGGVDINAFEVVSRHQVDPSLAGLRSKSAPAKTDRWWWNG